MACLKKSFTQNFNMHINFRMLRSTFIRNASTISTSRVGGITTVKLDNGPVNLLSGSLLDEFSTTFESFKSDNYSRVVILTSGIMLIGSFNLTREAKLAQCLCKNYLTD